MTNRIRVSEFVEEHNLMPFLDGIYFTEGNLKVNKLLELGIGRHYDDDDEELRAASQAGIQAIKSHPWR